VKKSKTRRKLVAKESLAGFISVIILIMAIAAIHHIALGPKYGLSIQGSKLLGERMYWQSVINKLKKDPPTPPENCKCIAFLTPSDSIYLKQLRDERECEYEAEKLGRKNYFPIAYLPSKCPRTVEEFKKQYTG